MKKVLFFLVLAAGIAATASAQLPHKSSALCGSVSGGRIAHDKTMEFDDAILYQVLGNGNMITKSKTTSTVTEERLKATSHYYYLDNGVTAPWGKGDSAYYFYSGERRSLFDFNRMFYYGTINNYGPYLYLDFPIGGGQKWGYRDQDFKPDILADSAYYFGSTDTMFAATYHTFDAADNITVYEIPQHQRILRNFNSDNRSTSIEFFDYNGTGWDSTERRNVGYSSNSVTSDSTLIYSVLSGPTKYKNVYTYDGSGRLMVADGFAYDGGIWHPFTKYTFDYYSNGKVRRLTGSWAASMAPWTPLDTMWVENIVWTSGVPYTTYAERLDMQGGIVTGRHIMSKHLSPANLPDTVRLLSYSYATTATDTFDQISTFAYDSYNNPVTATIRHKTNPSSAVYDSLDDMQHFYYELFTRDNTGVTTVKNGNFKIYPNPASSELFISECDAATLSTIKVYDVTGRLVINAEVGTTGNTNINMSNLPQGVYIVWLQDAGGNVQQREKVVKQ